MQDNRLILRENSSGRGLLTVTVGLLVVGVVMVHSAIASVMEPGQWYSRVDVRHTIFAVLAGVIVFLGWRFDYRRLAAGKKFPIPAAGLLVAALILAGLVFVPGIGRSVGGCYRWIRVGPSRYSIGFQPSELVKVALVIFLSAWLSRPGVNPRGFRGAFLPAVLITGLCVAMVVTEDLGTAVIIAAAAAVTMLLAGLPWYYLLSLVPPAGAGFYFFIARNSHRMLRIQAMFDPWSTTNPSAYQPRQSLIAMITGGWFGKGLGRGTMKFGFLPEDSTDYIFSAFCEECGFAGAIILMGLVAAWIWYARRISVKAPGKFARVLAGSLGFLIAIQAVLHVAVNMAILPPTGISLPFVSAGGTSLVISAAIVALIISVSSNTDDETF